MGIFKSIKELKNAVHEFEETMKNYQKTKNEWKKVLVDMDDFYKAMRSHND